VVLLVEKALQDQKVQKVQLVQMVPQERMEPMVKTLYGALKANG
jgi:hypothetical protein